MFTALQSYSYRSFETNWHLSNFRILDSGHAQKFILIMYKDLQKYLPTYVALNRKKIARLILLSHEHNLTIVRILPYFFLPIMNLSMGFKLQM